MICLFAQDWENETQVASVAISLAVCAAAIPIAAGLAGLLCRRRYRPLVLCAAMLVMLLSLWALVMLPIFLLQTAGRGQSVPVSDIAEPVLAMTGLCFGVLLPFLLLSFSNTLYRERLIRLLRLAPEPPPVTAPPPVPVLNP